MQTFVPSSKSFTESAKFLDNQRLGKQRVETLQIVNTLLDPQYGWRSHPAVHMWDGHVAALCDYGEAVCDEWISRGYKDSLKPQMRALRELALASDSSNLKPDWWGDEELHVSHQSNLLRKDFDYYKDLFPDVPPTLEYVWPIKGITDVTRKNFDDSVKYPDSFCHCEDTDFEALRFYKGFKKPQGSGTWWRCVVCRSPLEAWYSIAKNYLDREIVKNYFLL